MQDEDIKTETCPHCNSEVTITKLPPNAGAKEWTEMGIANGHHDDCEWIRGKGLTKDSVMSVPEARPGKKFDGFGP